MVAAALGSCGGDPCGIDPSTDPGAPSITSLTLLDADERAAYDELQLMGADPWLVVLALAVADSEGDLAGGEAVIYLRGQDVVHADLEELLRQRGLPLRSVTATVPLVVRVEPPADILTDGGVTTVSLGVAVTDVLGRSSTCEPIDVTVAFTP